MTKDRDLRTLVFAALNNALTNGHADLALKEDATTTAVDLLDYDVAIFEAFPECLSVGDVADHVEAWRADRAAA